MKALVSLLMICSASFIAGCSSFPESTKEMEMRAEYGKIMAVDTKSEAPRRKKQRVEKVFMGGRILPSGDWFMGGKLLLVVNESDWIFDDANLRKIESQ
jgi:hypothetical protein